jgi:hypothetical protein
MSAARTWSWKRLRASALAILFLFLSNVALFDSGMSRSLGLERGGFGISTREIYCVGQGREDDRAPVDHGHHDCVFCVSGSCQPSLEAISSPSERVPIISPGETSRLAWQLRNDLARAPPAWASSWSSRAPPSLS